MGQFYSTFGGGGDTNMTAVGVVCIALAIFLLFFLSRKYVLRPMLMVAFLMTMGQTLVVGGLHFMAIRILVLAAWARVVMGKKEERLQLNALDWAFILWNVSTVITFTLLYQSSDAFVNRLGSTYTAIGVYFFFRYFCRDIEDVDRLIRFFAILTIILGGCMLLEQVTGRNLFAVFGGVPAMTVVRDGSLRSQASFGNPILAGTFGAVMLPLFLGSWIYLKRSRMLFTLASMSSLIMIVTAHSSTAIGALVAMVVGFGLWPMRRKMRMVRWVVVFGLITLHLVMKAPVWALIGRIDVVGGSSQQREALVDGFIRHYADWFLTGSRNYASWNWYSVDLDNQYVYEGTNGGITTLGCFLAILVFCFKMLGRARKAVEGIDRAAEWRVWTLGVALFAEMAAFMGISYFDNSTVGWFALLVMIQATTATILATAPAEQKQEKETFEPFGVRPAPLPALPGLASGKTGTNVPSLGFHRKSQL